MYGRDRQGFTMVELIIVTVLGALVVGATLQVLITNQRTYTAQNAQVQGQQASRMALDVLTSELREVSPSGGDLIAMASDSVRVRRMRRFGLACDVYLSGQSNTFRIAKIGDWFEPQDSTVIFADNNQNDPDDDAWVAAEITGVDTTTTCPDGSQAVDVTFGGQGSLFNQDVNPGADSVRVGAPIRSFRYYTFGLTSYAGDTYLGRREGANDFVPIAGPLKADDGLELGFRDANGNTTTTAADVRQIVVKLRTASGVMDSQGRMVSDSITAWIHTRN